MTHAIPPTHADILDCFLCGETALGPAGSSVCLTCLGSASACHDGDSDVIVTLYADETVTLDVEHAVNCPRRVA